MSKHKRKVRTIQIDDTNKLNSLMELLGESNVNNLRSKLTEFIAEAVKDDLEEFTRMNYTIDPDDIYDFIDECKKEAFENVKHDLINEFEKKIRASVSVDM